MIQNNFLVKPPTDAISKPLNLSHSLVQAGKNTVSQKLNTKSQLSEEHNHSISSQIGSSSSARSLILLNQITQKSRKNPISLTERYDTRSGNLEGPAHFLLRHECKSELKLSNNPNINNEPDYLEASFDRADFRMLSLTPSNKMFYNMSNSSVNGKLLSEGKFYQPHSSQHTKKTIALDLDETLIYASSSNNSPDHVIHRLLQDNSSIIIKVSIRPYARDFIRILSTLANIVIFTASAKSYADPIIDIIDPNREFIKTRYYRDSCVSSSAGFIKDLNILKKPLKDVLLIDNLSTSFLYQKQNGILVTSWYGDKNDMELFHLLGFIRKILPYEDVRKCDKNFRRLDNI
ncbi:hypothetical protein SteCoe_29833 [Stentor coeruleus]|uniref:FCP1 homology domain-containing protein n=1 Tax=Stentor coeruleus TaxID=5963 RepID=A0A1R2B4Z7_9CILI|nr:hypothetical protein SteCoe_29833 [Stentor coeruleus]